MQSNSFFMAALFGGLIIINLFMVSQVRASPQGAIPEACHNMTPNHGVEPQSSTPPFITLLDKTEIEESDSILITVKSNVTGATFTGYLVVAMYEMEGKPDHFTGIFSDPSDGQVIDCMMPDTHVKSQTGATHRSNATKNSVTVRWNPNGFIGQVKIWTTFVENVDTFWVKQLAGTVTVTEADSSSTAAIPSTSFITVASVFLIALMFFTSME